MKRFEPNIDSSETFQGMIESENGDYVEYSEINKSVTKLFYCFYSDSKILFSFGENAESARNNYLENGDWSLAEYHKFHEVTDSAFSVRSTGEIEID